MPVMQPQNNHTDNSTTTRKRYKHAPRGFLSELPQKGDVVRYFVPSWFTVTMGTGSVALSISRFPFSFAGQQEIAWAVWWFNVMLFVVFSCLLLSRILFYSNTVRQLSEKPHQSLFLGAIPMSVSTVSNGVVLFWLPRFDSGAATAAGVLFWVNMPAVLVCVLLIPLSMFTTVHDEAPRGLQGMSAVWLMPVIPACVATNAAGIVAAKLDDAEQAMNIIYAGVCLLGIGFLLSYQICSIYYSRLNLDSLPAKELIVSSFLPVGPMAMTAWAILTLVLGGAAQLPRYLTDHPDIQINSEWLTNVILPTAVSATGVLALFLWGYATWWLALAVCCVVATMRQGIPFNLGWWGSVFPVGVYTGATIQLGHVLHSTVFLILGAISVCAQVLTWLVVLARTCRKAWTGHLFYGPCLTPKMGTLRDGDGQNAEDATLELADDVAQELRDLETQLSQKVGSFRSTRAGSGVSSLDSSHRSPVAEAGGGHSPGLIDHVHDLT